jgi:hypothetical protein
VTEFRALALIFVAACALSAGVTAGLSAMQANGSLIALAVILIIGVGASACTLVGMHYSDGRSQR